MAVETTPLGFKKPDGNELIKGGDNAISDNAQLAEDLIAELQRRNPANFDGGGPRTVFTPEQTIDGGMV